MLKFLFSILLIYLFTPTAFAQNTASEAPLPETYRVRVSPDSDEVYLARYRFVDETRIDIGNLRVDRTVADAANLPWYWPFRPDTRATLLRNRILYDPRIGPAPSTPAEGVSNSASSNITQAAVQPDATSGSWLSALFTWIKNNPALVIGILSLPALGWLIKRTGRKVTTVRTTKRVEILYAGLPAAGKTALIARLRHPDLAPEHFDSDETTRIVEKKKYEPIIKSGLTFVPTAYDIPGSKPGSFIDVIRQGTPVFGRRVLLVVLAPFAVNPLGKSKEDAGFLREQGGYVFGLIGGVLTAKTLTKPDLVVIFLNKLDLFDGDREAFHSIFKDDTDRIFLLCKDKNVKCIRVSGSARTGDGTKGILGSIIERIGG